MKTTDAIVVSVLFLQGGCCTTTAPSAQASRAPAPVVRPSPALAAAPTTPTTAASRDAREGIDPEAATGFRQVGATHGQGAVAAAAHPVAARAGFDMLKRGGSAVDAAVAMATTLTVVEPQSSGIGGGAFLLHFDASDKSIAAFDGRETAPGAATPDMFLLPDGKPRRFYDAVVGGLSVGVPGELRMLELAHKKHGRLPWKTLFGPAIAAASDGFVVTNRLHLLLKGDRTLRKTPYAREHYYQPNGEPKAVGTRLKNPALAEVFRLVADGGADAFYQGPIAGDIVAAIRKHHNPGRMVVADLKNYRAKERKPVCSDFLKARVCGMPPPTSGGVAVLQILKLVEPHLAALPQEVMKANLKWYGGKSVGRGAAATHIFAEASRLAFADRNQYLADSDFVDVPVAKLLDPVYLSRRAKSISTTKSLGNGLPGLPRQARLKGLDNSLELPSTSHLVAADAQGNVVSMTASIETAFGAHVMVRGFLLNNELTDFSFEPTVDGKPVANRIEGGKRPRSSMAPFIAVDRKTGDVVLALGSPGGSRIINYVARVLINVLAHGVRLQTAIALPNVVNRNGVTELERHPTFGHDVDGVKATLEKLGHQVVIRNLNSGIHGVQRVGDKWLGGADPRREGVVLAN